MWSCGGIDEPTEDRAVLKSALAYATLALVITFVFVVELVVIPLDFLLDKICGRTKEPLRRTSVDSECT